jgi:hypothetical protein
MKRGRKSAQEMATGPVLAFNRKAPEPPPILTDAEAEVWRSLIISPGGSLITSEALPLLKELCRQIVKADLIAKEIREFKPEWLPVNGGLERFDHLLRVQDRIADRISSLASRLRLSPRSRAHKEASGRQIGNQPDPDRPRPWDYQA